MMTPQEAVALNVLGDPFICPPTSLFGLHLTFWLVQETAFWMERERVP